MPTSSPPAASFEPPYGVIAETALSPFGIVDGRGTIVWVSASVSELLGYSPADVVGRNMIELIAPHHHGLAMEGFSSISAHAGVDRTRTRVAGGMPMDLVAADGSIVPCELSVATPARTGLRDYVVQIRRGGTARSLRAAVRAMAAGAALDEVLTDLAHLLAADLTGTTVEIAHGWSGDRFAAVTAAGPGPLAADRPGPGRRPWVEAMTAASPVAVDTLDSLPAPVREAAAGHGMTGVWAHPVPGRGDASPTAVVAVWKRDPAPFSVLVRQTVAEAADLVALALQWHDGRTALEWAADHDPLTGLENRRSFLDQLRGVTTGGGHPLGRSALLYLDLDDFKPVNDVHGHGFGDRVLAVVAQRLAGALRPGDVVARLGGDEFAVLCPGLDGHDAAEELAGRLIEAASRPISIEGTTVQVGMSAGLTFVELGADPDDVLDAADVELRRAKGEGKGRLASPPRPR